MTYRAIFLDMDHTLCDTDRADKLGLEEFQLVLSTDFKREAACTIGEKYLTAIYGGNRGLPGWQREAEDTEAGYRAKLLKKTIAQLEEASLSSNKLVEYADLFMELRVKHYAFFPETTDMLKRLRLSYKLILISNGPLYSQEPKIKKVVMDDHVDEIILGGALEHQKPHPSIFRLACRRAGCENNEAIHVGDNLDSDIMGAKKTGITSVWVNPSADTPEPDILPDYTIRNINALENLLSHITV